MVKAALPITNSDLLCPQRPNRLGVWGLGLEPARGSPGGPDPELEGS